MDNVKIENRIRILRKIYVFFIAFPLLYAIAVAGSGLYVDTGHFQRNLLELTLSSFVFSVTYWGLKKRREWVVLVVLFSSYMMLIANLVFIIAEGAPGTGALAQRFGAAPYVLFSAYQINLFSKKEVSSYFKDKGAVLI